MIGFFTYTKRTVLFFLITFLFFPEQAPANPKSVAALPSEADLSKTQEFYIHSVEDYRLNKNELQVLASKNNMPPFFSAPLENMRFSDIRQFLFSTMVQNQELRPVIIRVHRLKISEKVDGERIHGKVDMKLSFHLMTTGSVTDLVEYEGIANYGRSFTNKAVPVSALQQALTHGMKYFIAWMDQERSRNPKLARAVRFHFKEYLDQEEDTVYYSPLRPLTWADFKDSPKNNGFGAEVFAGFGFDQYSQIDNGIIDVTISTRVFVPKSGSWVRPDNRNSYALNHEQRHFDLTRIISERFKREILQANLTPDNYEGFLGPHYLETLRQMNRLQEQYDNETRHGMDKGKQDAWNRRIDAELKGYGVKIVQQQ